MTVESSVFKSINALEGIKIYPYFQAMLKTCFPHFPENVQDQFLNQWSLERFKSLAKQKLVSGLFHHEIPLGFAVTSPLEGGVGTIFWLMVTDTWQRKGLGSHLLSHVENQYRTQKCHKIKLTAPSLTACQFYEKNGFNVEGYHPLHWHQMDFWSLAKHLSRNP